MKHKLIAFLHYYCSLCTACYDLQDLTASMPGFDWYKEWLQYLLLMFPSAAENLFFLSQF
jgi:hypothetical protein